MSDLFVSVHMITRPNGSTDGFFEKELNGILYEFNFTLMKDSIKVDVCEHDHDVPVFNEVLTDEINTDIYKKTVDVEDFFDQVCLIEDELTRIVLERFKP